MLFRSEMASIAFRYDGYIDKFIGDGMMVVFGDPIARDDHALSAVRAAIEMQKKVRELKQNWSNVNRFPIKIRIGINTGEVTVGNMGSKSRMDYTVLGANVNLAQRLEANAPMEGILISDAVYQKVKDHVQTKPVSELHVKGLTERIIAYEVPVV